MGEIEKIGQFTTKDKELAKELQKLLIDKGFLLQKITDNMFEKSFCIFKKCQ